MSADGNEVRADADEATRDANQVSSDGDKVIWNVNVHDAVKTIHTAIESDLIRFLPLKAFNSTMTREWLVH